MGANLAAIRAEFNPAPGTAYLDTASYGLPPRATVEALREAVGAWQAGTAWWLDDWDVQGEECRAAFATLIGATSDEVALVPTVSVAVAAVAASLEAGDEVLVPAEEFTSGLFPFLVVAERRGVRVRQAPFRALAEAVGAETRLVATSLVRSQDGAVVDLEPVLAAAEAPRGAGADRCHPRGAVRASGAISGADRLPHLPRLQAPALPARGRLLSDPP